ncbi:retinol dehydrogenase 7-like [Haemaphysalis longicornis]
MITLAPLTIPTALLLWHIACRMEWLLDIATITGLLLITLSSAYWGLWHIRRIFFNGLIDPTGKCVLITGCDTGFGHLLAAQLASEGFFVYAGCLDENGHGASLHKERDNIRVLQMDVTKPEQIDQALETVEATLDGGELWAVVSNAGVPTLGYAEWQPMSRVRTVFDVNTFGALAVATAFLPLLKKAKGRLVFVTTWLARFTLPETVIYCMSKSASNSLADGLRRQYYNTGVHVITVEPGGYRTAMTDHKLMEETFDRDTALLPKRVRMKLEERATEDMKRGLDMLHSTIIREDIQEVVDALKSAVSERLPRTTYKPGGFLDGLLRLFNNTAPVELVDGVIDFARRIAIRLKIK